ncbi:MBL fold metallo-hydrolase [Elizabethkingia occulta]|uniref:Metallo-beta-lactamase domain-containing protein n=1 Tax=Elizabethkingia occulta TaxID=1867263 RepID=A0A1T3MWX5_9FLAO|nr:MBL fold metallo-hydrolase [Elizabethkingia occulta]OPC69026.1 hypothetical protein BAZ10_00355 [Elizabethkingia occulta]
MSKFLFNLLLFGGLLFPLSGQSQNINTPEPTNLIAAPNIRPETAIKVANDVWVIPDPRINYIPNIGVIEGKYAVLVVDSGMGPHNGELLLQYVQKIAGNRRIYFTSTHFHPEHNFGASVFGTASVIMNKAQAEELAEKGSDYIQLFRSFGVIERKALEGVKLIMPGIIYSDSLTLDLGDNIVILKETPAHTRGDQIVFTENSKVLFTGDLVENRFFPIMPDADTKGSDWITVMEQMLNMKPKVVVPGHGEIGDDRLIQAVKTYLVTVQSDVLDLVKKGLKQDSIIRTLTQKFKSLHPNWDNAVFIPYEIANFYSEFTHSPLKLPDLSKDLGH